MRGKLIMFRLGSAGIMLDVGGTVRSCRGSGDRMTETTKTFILGFICGIVGAVTYAILHGWIP
jgi:hypothetical protein